MCSNSYLLIQYNWQQCCEDKKEPDIDLDDIEDKYPSEWIITYRN